MAEQGVVWEFHPSLNAVGGDPVDVESHLLQRTDTGKMVHHLIRRLYQCHPNLSFNVYMDKFVTTQPLLAELRQMGIQHVAHAGSSFEDFLRSERLGRMRNCHIIFEVELSMIGSQPCYGWTVRLLA